MTAALKIPRDAPPGEAGHDLYLAVRGGLVARGSSLNKWAIEHGVSHQWAYQALTGRECGPAARRLVRRLKRDAGLTA